MTLAERNRNDSNAIPCVYASYRIKYLEKAGETNIFNTFFLSPVHKGVDPNFL
jgi:hypothetical protein